jgi:hypothetical protein
VTGTVRVAHWNLLPHPFHVSDEPEEPARAALAGTTGLRNAVNMSGMRTRSAGVGRPRRTGRIAPGCLTEIDGSARVQPAGVTPSDVPTTPRVAAGVTP